LKKGEKNKKNKERKGGLDAQLDIMESGHRSYGKGGQGKLIFLYQKV